MHLDNIGYLVAVLVDVEELQDDAGVAEDDDRGGHDQVEGEHGDDKGEAFVLHLSPGQRAGQAKGLGPVSAPAQYGAQGPEQGVEPRPRAQELHVAAADLLICPQR